MDIDNEHDDAHDGEHDGEHGDAHGDVHGNGNDKGDEGVRCSFAEVDLEFPGGQVKAVTSIIKNDNHYNNEDDGRSPVELQVLPKHIYIGHKYKTKWSAVTNVTVEEEHDDDGDIVIAVVITCPTFTVLARGPPHPQRGQGQGQGQALGTGTGTGTGLLSVSACSKYLLKRWHKRQRKVQRKLEQEKEHANKNNNNNNTTSRKNTSRLRTSTKGRTSKASTFLLKNAHNMREWESDDDQVFNRLPPKELKRRQQQERQEEEEEEEQQEQQDGAPTEERNDDKDDDDDDDEQEACFENDASNLNEDADDTMVEEQAEVEMTQDQDQDHHVPLDDDSDNEEKDVPPPPKTTKISGKPFKGLKRRRILEEEEEDSDDDDLFGAPLPDMTTPMAQRIVSPGTTTNTLRTGVIDDEDDDDDDDDENDNDNNIMADSETDKEEPPLADMTSSKPTTSKPVVSKNMASFFAPKVTPVATTKTALVTETETATATTKKRVVAPNFFAPRKAAASVVVVTTETTTKMTTSTKAPVALALEEEEEMFVSTPTPNGDCPMTPPRSSAAKRSLLLTSVYQSAKKLQLDVHSDDDPIIEDSDDEDPKQHPPLLLSPRFRSPLKQRLGGGAMAASNMKKRRLFRTYGSKPAPLRNTASSALDMAEAKSVSSSPVRHRSPFAGMDATGKRLLSPRRLSPVANQANVLATTPTTTTPTTTRITSPATRKHVLSKWRGLKNLGNTCYMNSSLQFLYSVPSFVQSLQQRSRTKKGAGTGAAGVRRLTQAFCQTYQALQTSAPGAVLARPLKTAMDAATTKFQGFQQRDAHEFLGELLDQLYEELEGEDAAAAPAPDSGASVGEEEKTEKNDDFRGEEKKEEDLSTSGTTTNTTDAAVLSSTNGTTTSTTTADSVSPTDDFFRLTVEVCLQCKSCGYSRTKEEMYRYLSIDIDTPTQENTKPTVTQCLAQFFQPEDRDIKCEKCEEGTHATQTLKILERPKALLLHLKRFVVVESKREDQTVDISFKKNRSAVDLTSNLSLDTFCKANISDNNGEENGADTSSTSAMAKAHTHLYALKSVVHHIGSTANSGHYTADALRTTTKTKEEEEEESHPQWVSYDDGSTMETSFAKVQSSVQNQRTAYMLLYSTV